MDVLIIGTLTLTCMIFLGTLRSPRCLEEYEEHKKHCESNGTDDSCACPFCDLNKYNSK